MATIYSSLYHNPPNGQAGAAPIYQGPSGPNGSVSAGGVAVVRGSIVLPAAGLGAGDSAKLFVPNKSCMLLRISIIPSADLDSGNTFTFNLGWTSNANTHASASTGLQSASAFALKAEDMYAQAASVKGDELILARVAGALAQGTLYFIAEMNYDNI